VYCMREASKSTDAQLQLGANAYLNDLNKEYHTAVAIDATWYKANASDLSQARELTDKIKLLSRLIVDELSAGEFISDNVALIDTPLKPIIAEYLDEWEQRCTMGKNVPRLLRERLELRG
jgi:hypothetical protein